MRNHHRLRSPSSSRTAEKSGLPGASADQVGRQPQHTDHLIIQYSRDGGASWFRIAQDVPAFTVGYWWQVDNFPTTQGRVKILLQENLSITDQSDANFTVQRP